MRCERRGSGLVRPVDMKKAGGDTSYCGSMAYGPMAKMEAADMGVSGTRPHESSQGRMGTGAEDQIGWRAAGALEWGCIRTRPGAR
jgi:hypothetical protein